MNLTRNIFFAALLSWITASSALAQTEARQAQFDELWNRASDASQGVYVGSAKVIADGGWLLLDEDACTFSRLVNADDICTYSAILFPPEGVAIDSIYYTPSEDIGHVNMDEWTEDVKSQIDDLWDGYVEGAKAQSTRIGFDVVPLKWVQYPTLNKASKVMTYGILVDFGGDEVINLTVVKFTRVGYAAMELVTSDEMLAADALNFDGVSTYASDTYLPVEGTRYADFKVGDKVAAIGAVGVLASVMGVTQKKGTWAAIGAGILVFAKKLWFLLLLIPAAIWGAVKRLTGRGDPSA
jgi:uncharacterized membrane-anchored protein